MDFDAIALCPDLTDAGGYGRMFMSPERGFDMPATLPAAGALSATEIKDLFASLRPDPDWSFAYCTTRHTGRLTHGYHRYPAKFIPQIVDKLLDTYLNGAEHPTVNDLFMGSGTTIACAIERGYRATGTDVNEVACLITQAKSTPIDPARIARRRNWLAHRLRLLEMGYSNNGLPCTIPEVDRLDYWFPPEQKNELGQLLAALEEIEEDDERTFFLCGFSHILKNCSVWNMGSSKPARSKIKDPRRPWPTFLRHIAKMERRNQAFWDSVSDEVRDDIGAHLDVHCHDAREQPFADESADIQVTSPPYVTSYEYADLHQLTALWLSYTDNLRHFRKKFIGTSSRRDTDELHGNSEIVRDMVDAVSETDLKTARGIERFFSDMSQCFSDTYRILKPGARACHVIGNTALKKVPILNAEAFAELMQEVGFQIEDVILREIPLKTLPQSRHPVTGRFARATSLRRVHAYPTEFIIVVRKPA